MTRPEEDVEIGATASPAVGALGATSDAFDAAAVGEVVSEEIKVVWRAMLLSPSETNLLRAWGALS